MFEQILCIWNSKNRPTHLESWLSLDWSRKWNLCVCIFWFSLFRSFTVLAVLLAVLLTVPNISKPIDGLSTKWCVHLQVSANLLEHCSSIERKITEWQTYPFKPLIALPLLDNTERSKWKWSLNVEIGLSSIFFLFRILFCQFDRSYEFNLKNFVEPFGRWAASLDLSTCESPDFFFETSSWDQLTNSFYHKTVLRLPSVRAGSFENLIVARFFRILSWIGRFGNLWTPS